MSIIFGVIQAENHTVEGNRLSVLAHATDRYAPDGTFVRAVGRVGMGFQPYHTHQRSNLESQPYGDPHGNMLTFDGRLDNHAELSQLLDIRDRDAPDSLVVLASFQRWGEDCFSRFIGDWTLALWSHKDRALYLARDHAGTRTLYFEQRGSEVLWSTFLETFFVEGQPHEFDETYLAGYLSCEPIRDMTPYKKIMAVSPAHYLKVKNQFVTRKAHWQWFAKRRISYKSSREYEEHFFELFQQSVERRTGAGAPIMAQLSGGIDSSSIVCMADYVMRSQGRSAANFLDTVSYFSNTEPSWDEKPFFTALEAERGKQGVHIDVSLFERVFESPSPLYLLPGVDGNSMLRERTFQSHFEKKGYRVLLSGIGGDELLGGVPTPDPELADYLVSGRWKTLLKRSFEWCVPNRTPLIHLLAHILAVSLDLYRGPRVQSNLIAPWLSPHLRDLYRRRTLYDIDKSTRLGLRPSAIENGISWWHIMETLPHRAHEFLFRYEYRYPYLDRDLVDYLFCVPRAQLVQPGRRRFLMRNALKKIVPMKILERRRKGFLIRNRLTFLQKNETELQRLLATSLLVRHLDIRPDLFLRALYGTLTGQDIKWWPAIDRFVLLELWFRSRQETAQLYLLP